jgi:hypothetical protein
MVAKIRIQGLTVIDNSSGSIIFFQKFRKLVKIEDDVAALRKKLNPIKAAAIDTEFEL